MPLASPAAWATAIRALYQKDWVVYAKEPFGGPEQVLKYLTRYTHRVALSNRRLVKLEDGRVTFTWKDYADGYRRKKMTLEAVEFVRRFALHVIPKGLVRIRQYGLLAHRDRGERLALCRSLLRGEDRHQPQGPRRRHRVPVPDRRTAASYPLGGTSAVSGRAQAGITVSDGYLHPGGLGFARVATGDTASFASSLAVPPAAVIVEDRCPGCGVGHLQTIWQAADPDG